MIRLPECPVCAKPVPPASDPNAGFAPFCSRRCKEEDLVRWFDGKYAIIESIDPERLVDLVPGQDTLASDDESDSTGFDQE